MDSKAMGTGITRLPSEKAFHWSNTVPITYGSKRTPMVLNSKAAQNETRIARRIPILMKAHAMANVSTNQKGEEAQCTNAATGAIIMQIAPKQNAANPCSDATIRTGGGRLQLFGTELLI